MAKQRKRVKDETDLPTATSTALSRIANQKKNVKGKPDLPGRASEAPAQAADAAHMTGDESRRERIAAAAYYRAESRNFEGDRQLADWLEAEREIDSLASAGGIQGEASKRSEGVSDVSGTAIRQAPTGGLDEERIEPDDVKRWAAELAVPAGSLRVAIARVGPRVVDVKRYLEHHEGK